MGLFSKIKSAVKKVSNVVGDTAKGIAKTVASPVNALTGHEYNPNMKTGFGRALEKGADFVEDVQTKAVNTATLGLAKKVNLYDGKVETKAGKIVGTAAGVAALAGGALAGAGALGGAGLLGSKAALAAGGAKTLLGSGVAVLKTGGAALLGGKGVAGILGGKAGVAGLGNLTSLINGGGTQQAAQEAALDNQVFSPLNQTQMEQQELTFIQKVQIFFLLHWQKLVAVVGIAGAAYMLWKWYKGRGRRR